MTPQQRPYRPQHSQQHQHSHPQQPSSSQTPDSSTSDGHSSGGGDGRVRRVTRMPYASPSFPASATAVSQADGEA